MKEGFFSKAKEVVKKAVKTGVLIGATGAAMLPKESEAQNKHQKNNERAPIEVNDSNDSRLKAYNDSLNLYKAYKFQKANQVPDYDTWRYLKDLKLGDKRPYQPHEIKKFSPEEINRQSREFKKWADSGPNWFKDKEKLKKFPAIEGGASARNLGEFKGGEERLTPYGRSSIRIAEYYESLGFKPDQIGYYSSPDVYNPKIKPVAEYFDGVAWSPVYKKPIQPYVYKETINKEKSEKGDYKIINGDTARFYQGYKLWEEAGLRPGYYTDEQIKEAKIEKLQEKIKKDLGK